jgi:hypothetical protein
MLSILFTALLSITTVFDNPVISRVVDSQGEPVSFARVYTEDSEVYTDINGFFELDTKSDSLTISALSYSELTLCTKDCSSRIVIKDLKPQNIIVRK